MWDPVNVGSWDCVIPGMWGPGLPLTHFNPCPADGSWLPFRSRQPLQGKGHRELFLFLLLSRLGFSLG